MIHMLTLQTKMEEAQSTKKETDNHPELRLLRILQKNEILWPQRKKGDLQLDLIRMYMLSTTMKVHK